MKAKLQLLLKVIFVIGLLYFLGKKGFLSLEQTRQALTQWRYSIPGILGILLASYLGVIRWNWLLKAHSIDFPLPRVTELTYIGFFYNIALPGAVSGDFVKAYLVGKEIQGQRAKAFGSILFDRVAGLSALVVLSAVSFLLEMTQTDSAFLKAIQFFLILSGVVVIAFYGYLFLVQEHHDPLLKFFKYLESWKSKLGVLSRTYEAIRHYHSHRVTVVKVLLLSLGVHCMIGWCCLQFLYAFGGTQIGLLPVYVIVPIGLLITAIPVLPAGVGTGHAAFLYLFHLLGSERGADIFSIYALAQIIVGAIGGLFYLRFRSSTPIPLVESA